MVLLAWLINVERDCNSLMTSARRSGKMDTAINHKEMRMDNGSDFLVDEFFDICVPVLIDSIAWFSFLFVDGVPLAHAGLFC